MNSKCTPPEMLHHATCALQAQERLIRSMRQHLKNGATTSDVCPLSAKDIESCIEMRSKLRDIRSRIEGSAVDIDKLSVVDDPEVTAAVKQLRQLMLLNLAYTISDDVKQLMVKLLNTCFARKWKRLLFAAVVSCPWYTSAQPESGRRAKNNELFIVYVGKDGQFFSPVIQQMKGNDVFEHENWLSAVEVFHFINCVTNGKVRFVESLFVPNSCWLFADDHWMQLTELAMEYRFFGMSKFLEQCRGQAVGSVGKKSKSGAMALKEAAQLLDFCDSYRLLQHANCVLNNKNITMLSIDQSLPLAVEAANLLRAAYINCETITVGGACATKESLFTLVMQWRKHVDEQFNQFHFTDTTVVKRVLGEWLSKVRLHGSELVSTIDARFNSSGDPNCEERLMKLLSQIGHTVSQLQPQQVVMIARAGSHLYDLAKASSDVDYIVIYAEPLQKLASAVVYIQESSESRGPEKELEYGAYEVRMLAEMLWKGSVVMLELVYAEELDYCSEFWKMLVSNREVFVTEQAVVQYFGLVENNLSVIEGRKHEGTARELKLFYQIFHKLHCLEFFLRGQCPKIKCTGETRDFILGVRNANPENYDRERLLAKVKEQVNLLKCAFSERNERLPEYVNYQFISNWLMTVRGIK